MTRHLPERTNPREAHVHKIFSLEQRSMGRNKEGLWALEGRA